MQGVIFYEFQFLWLNLLREIVYLQKSLDSRLLVAEPLILYMKN